MRKRAVISLNSPSKKVVYSKSYAKKFVKPRHQPGGTQLPLEKWQLGMDRLAKAEIEPALLGLAMSSIHGALEDQFRRMLTSLPQLSQSERIRVNDVNQVKWRELRDLMQKYLALDDQDARYIMHMNQIRNEAAHGGEFRGSYQDVAAYSEFVKKWLDTTEAEWLNAATTEQLDVDTNRTTYDSHSFIHCCPRCQSKRIKSLELIYHQGISVIERGRNNVQTRQTGLSLQAAPPRKKNYIPQISVWWLILGAFLVSFTGFLLVLVIIWAYRVWKFNETEYPRLLKAWRHTFRCEQCAHTFLLQFEDTAI